MTRVRAFQDTWIHYNDDKTKIPMQKQNIIRPIKKKRLRTHHVSELVSKRTQNSQ